MFHWTWCRSLTSGKMLKFFLRFEFGIFFNIKLYVLSIRTMTWSNLPPLNIGRTVHTMAFLNGELMRQINFLTFSCTPTLIGSKRSKQNGLGHKQSWAQTMEKVIYIFFIIFLVAICHSFYVYFLSYNTLQNMVGSHHTIYDEAWAGWRFMSRISGFF